MVSLAEGVLGLAFFWLLLSVLSQRLNLVRFGILIGPVMLILRTTKLNGFIRFLTHDNVKPAWKKIGNFSSYIVLSMFIAFPFLLIYNLIKGYFGESSYLLPQSPVKYLDISILVFIFPLFIAISISQIAKGLMASAEGVEAKSSGLFVVVILIFGIVQSSQEALEKINRKSLFRIISFGIIANLLVSLLFIQFSGVSQDMIDPLFDEPQGAIITSVEPNGPAVGFLLVGDIIIGLKTLNFNTVKVNYQINSRQDLTQLLRSIPAQEPFLLILTSIQIRISGITPPVGVQIGSYIGIEVYDYLPPKSALLNPLFPYYFDLFIQWTIALNLFFATFNLLPFPYSDGKKITSELLEMYEKEEEKRKRYMNYITFTSVFLILLNLQATIW